MRLVGLFASQRFDQTEPQLRTKTPKGADLYAALVVAAAAVIIWGGILYVLMKAIYFWFV